MKPFPTSGLIHAQTSITLFAQRATTKFGEISIKEEYPNIRGYHTQPVAKQSEQIVLKKK